MWLKRRLVDVYTLFSLPLRLTFARCSTVLSKFVSTTDASRRGEVKIYPVSPLKRRRIEEQLIEELETPPATVGGRDGGSKHEDESVRL